MVKVDKDALPGVALNFTDPDTGPPTNEQFMDFNIFHSEDHIETPFVPALPIVNEDKTINDDFDTTGNGAAFSAQLMNKPSKIP